MLINYLILGLYSYYFIHIPVAVPVSIFLACIGHKKHCGNKHMQGANITPLTPSCRYFTKIIDSGI